MLGKHLFGIYEKAFGYENSLKEKFSKAKSLGFDCMELSIDPSDIRLKRLYLSDHELDAIAGFDDYISVYRGTTQQEDTPGISWTTRKSVAEDYPFNRGRVFRAVIPKSAILLYDNV